MDPLLPLGESRVDRDNERPQRSAGHSGKSPVNTFCHYCGEPAAAGQPFCPRCGAALRGKDWAADVYGQDSGEVAAVSKEIASHMATISGKDSGLWLRGSFWLLTLVVIAALVLAMAKLVPWWLFVAVFASTVLLTYALGTFILLQGGHLTERSFVNITKAIVRQLGPAKGWIQKRP
jgi:hypothetical protein